jgi:methionyl-tRNA formyltransferase
MNRTLIISDNQKLALSTLETIQEQNLYEISNFFFCYSKNNKFPQPMIDIGFQPIDLKEPTDCNWASENFPNILSIHCKQIFPQQLVLKNTCINLHPGFNPFNRGWYPQVFSILEKNPFGTTLHLITNEIDAGPIIDQIRVPIKESDTSLEAYNRVIHAECEIIKINLKKILLGDYQTHPPPDQGNYNSAKDFKAICELNLEKSGTLREHIDLLRALSHGEYRNAYFFSENGKKIYIRVILDEQ